MPLSLFFFIATTDPLLSVYLSISFSPSASSISVHECAHHTNVFAIILLRSYTHLALVVSVRPRCARTYSARFAFLSVLLSAASSSRSHVRSSARILCRSHSHTRVPRLPSVPPEPPFSTRLSPSLAIVRVRIPSIFVDRQCIHASSPSPRREQTRIRARARELRRREVQRGWARGRQKEKESRTEGEREREREKREEEREQQ